MHVIRQMERPNSEAVNNLSKYGTATIYEAMGRKGALESFIKPIGMGMKCCGVALTVCNHACDNLMLHKAIEVAERGDVIIAVTGEYTEAGIWGEIMTTAAQAKGIVGLVTDGSIRDSEAIRRLGFPTFCKGISIKGSVKETPGTINEDVICAGIIIKPGDIIIGDDDGVVVVPQEIGADTVLKCRKREKKEEAIIEQLKSGKTTLEIYHLKEVLKKKGVSES